MSDLACGAEHPITGNPSPLVCNLEAGHEPPHGIRQSSTLPPYVTWGEGTWTAADDEERAERFQWRKGHVRREYQTLGMWKARH